MKNPWMASLDMRDFPSLEALSEGLRAYVRNYNLSAHSSLKGSTPQERFFSEPEKVRRLPEEKMKTDFLLELERRVSADSVVTIGNVEYEVDMRFARQRIRLRCSPGMERGLCGRGGRHPAPGKALEQAGERFREAGKTPPFRRG